MSPSGLTVASGLSSPQDDTHGILIHAVNAQRKGGSTEAIRAIMKTLDSFGTWLCAFISEVDGFLTTSASYAQDLGPNFHRYYDENSGCPAFAFLQNPRLSQCVTDIVARPRSLRTDYNGTIPEMRRRLQFSIVWAHLPPIDDQLNSLHDIAALAQGRPPGNELIIGGDLNIDMLPTSPFDPYAQNPGRQNHQELRRENWDNITNATRTIMLQSAVMQQRCRLDEDNFGLAPITRIPDGDQPGLPAWLDHFHVSRGLFKQLRKIPFRHELRATMGHATASINDSPHQFENVPHSLITWKDAPGDHSFISLTIPFTKPLYRTRPKLTWRPPENTEELIVQEIANNCPNQFDSIQHLERYCSETQQMFADQRSRRTRRQQREPWLIKDLRRRIRNAHSQIEAQDLKNRLWKQRKRFLHDKATQMKAEKLNAGRALHKGTKKLWEITAVKIQNPPHANTTTTINDDIWVDKIGENFKNKWTSSHPSDAAVVQEFSQDDPALNIVIPHAQLYDMLKKLRKRFNLDINGVAGKFLMYMCLANKAIPIANALTSCINNQDNVTSLCMHGRVKAKSPYAILPAQTRAIIPQTWALKLLHMTVQQNIGDKVIDTQHPSSAFFVGGRTGTQVADITTAASLGFEKGINERSKFVLTIADIKSYYDNIRPCPLVEELKIIEVDLPTIRATIRLHFCIPVVLHIASKTFRIGTRTKGLMTGSQSASTLSMVPINAAVNKCAPSIEKLGYKVPSGHITLCTWIDNLIAFSTSTDDGAKILDTFEQELKETWDMKYGEDSLEQLPCAGNTTQGTAAQRYTLKSCTRLLGTWISNNTSFHKDWEKLKHAVWTGYFQSFKGLRSKTTTKAKTGFLNAIARGLLNNRVQRWPASESAMKRLDKFQTHIFSRAMPMKRSPGQSADSYCINNNRQAKRTAEEHGLWSHYWKNMQMNYYMHLNRHPDRPPALILEKHPEAWLNRQRYTTGRATVNNRTDTRLPGLGAPLPRWTRCLLDNNPGLSTLQRLGYHQVKIWYMHG